MDIFLLIAAFVCMIIGIIGSILPAIPGAPLSYIGLLLLYFTSWQPIGIFTLVLYGVLTFFMLGIDFILPMLSARISGGSKQGTKGANIGMIIGFFIPMPLGMFIGAWLGCFIAELQTGASNTQAIRSAFAVLFALASGMLMKVLFACLIVVHSIFAFIML